MKNIFYVLINYYVVKFVLEDENDSKLFNCSPLFSLRIFKIFPLQLKIHRF